MLIETGLSRSHRSVRAASASASSEAATHATGPPLVSTTAVPLRGSDSASRDERSTDACGEGGEGLVVGLVVLARRPAPRRLLEPPLEGGLLRLALRRRGLVVDGEHLQVVELVPAGVDLDVRRPAGAVEDAGRGLAVPSHLAGDQQVGQRPRGPRAPRRAPATARGRWGRGRRSRRHRTRPVRAAPGGCGSLVVGAMSPSSRRPMICTAGPKRAYISLVVWPWK